MTSHEAVIDAGVMIVGAGAIGDVNKACSQHRRSRVDRHYKSNVAVIDRRGDHCHATYIVAGPSTSDVVTTDAGAIFAAEIGTCAMIIVNKHVASHSRRMRDDCP